MTNTRYFKMTEAQAKRFKKMMSLDRHRIAPPEVCASDLCLFGVQQLLDAGVLKKEDIDAILFISQTPDYILPATSNVIHGKLGLDHDVICLDINQGCCGLSHRIAAGLPAFGNPRRFQSAPADGRHRRANWWTARTAFPIPITGDAGAATVVERCPEERTIYMDVKNDGSRYKALIIPGGALSNAVLGRNAGTAGSGGRGHQMPGTR